METVDSFFDHKEYNDALTSVKCKIIPSRYDRKGFSLTRKYLRHTVHSRSLDAYAQSINVSTCVQFNQKAVYAWFKFDLADI